MTQLVMEMAAELSKGRLFWLWRRLQFRGPSGFGHDDPLELTGQSMINKEEMRQVEDARYGNIRPTLRR